MNKTATEDDQRLNHEMPPASSSVPPPPKLRRRPALLIVGLVAIGLGALLSAWAWTATTNTQEVLVARHTIERGAVIEAGDLVRVRLSADPALDPVPAAHFNDVVGQRATLDVAAGAMLTSESYRAVVVPSGANSIVGVALTPAQAPGLELATGDRVRVVVTPAQGEAATGVPQVSEATVAGVHISDETGQMIVDLLVPHADAAVVAARSATGNVALVLDSRDR